MIKVMVFGVFDGVHERHRKMLGEAKGLGDYLIVAVAQDHIVQHLKGGLPEVNLSERMEHLRKEDAVDEVIIGDAELGAWGVVKQYKPDVIAIGHDQNVLKEDLERNFDKLGYKPELKQLKEYEESRPHGE